MPLDPIHYSRIFPELRLIDTPAERKQAMEKAQVSVMPTWAVGLFMLVVVACAVGMFLTLEAFAAPKWAHGIGFGILPPAAVAVGGIWLFRRRIQRSLRRQLIDHGVPVCLKCGYQLRGQVERRERHLHR